ncbi:hypothetical protein AA313_de0204842 [Arthrobotrys entomopaga]|nr:hypothetical protein AA313_de0204842 [Arthrobotrys entomopaga]
MRLRSIGIYLIAGFHIQLSMAALAKLLVGTWKDFMNIPGISTPFKQLGIALQQFVDGALSSGSSDQPLAELATEFAAKLRETVARIQAMDLTTPEGLGQTPFFSEKQGVYAIESLLGFARIVEYIPKDAPIVSQFANKNLAFSRDFWNPDDESPTIYTVKTPPMLFPTIEKLARYIQTSVALQSPESVAIWLFAGYRDTYNVELDLRFFEDVYDGFLAIRWGLMHILEVFTGTWITISTRYNLADGLDTNFYTEMIRMQGYLEHRLTDVDAVVQALNGCYPPVAVFRGYKEQRPKRKEKQKYVIEEIKEEDTSPSP